MDLARQLLLFQFAVSPASFEGMEVWTFTSHVSTLTLSLSGHVEFIPRFIFYEGFSTHTAFNGPK